MRAITVVLIFLRCWTPSLIGYKGKTPQMPEPVPLSEERKARKKLKPPPLNAELPYFFPLQNAFLVLLNPVYPTCMPMSLYSILHSVDQGDDASLVRQVGLVRGRRRGRGRGGAGAAGRGAGGGGASRGAGGGSAGGDGGARGRRDARVGRAGRLLVVVVVVLLVLVLLVLVLLVLVLTVVGPDERELASIASWKEKRW